MRSDGSEFPVELTVTRIDLPGPPRNSPATCATSPSSSGPSRSCAPREPGWSRWSTLSAAPRARPPRRRPAAPRVARAGGSGRRGQGSRMNRRRRRAARPRDLRLAARPLSCASSPAVSIQPVTEGGLAPALSTLLRVRPARRGSWAFWTSDFRRRSRRRCTSSSRRRSPTPRATPMPLRCRSRFVGAAVASSSSLRRQGRRRPRTRIGPARYGRSDGRAGRLVRDPQPRWRRYEAARTNSLHGRRGNEPHAEMTAPAALAPAHRDTIRMLACCAS